MKTIETTKHDLRSAQILRAFSTVSVAALLIFGAAGCKSSSGPAPITTAVNDGTASTNPDNGGDPAAANLAPATQVLAQNSSYTPQQQSESNQNQQQAAPIEQGYNDQDQSDYNAGADAVDYSEQAPPPLPDYDQPPPPDPNYIWTPGYWANGGNGYYWVPGVWCPPPYYGALWTPPYWAFYNGRYGFHRGYWGPHVGYYGGVDYGNGYIGIGYFGGYWKGNNFYYNRAVTNVGNRDHVYDHSVVYDNHTFGHQPINHISYNGGHGGLDRRPQPSEYAAMHETHTGPLEAQTQLRTEAMHNKSQFYVDNHGRPAEAVAAHSIANHSIAAPPPAIRQEQQRANQERTVMAQHNNAPANEHNNANGHGNPAAEQHNNPANQQHNESQRNVPQNQQHNETQRNLPATQQHNEPQHNAPANQQHIQPQHNEPQHNNPAPQQHNEVQHNNATPHNEMQQRTVERAQPQQRPEAARPAPQEHAAPARPESRPAPSRPEARPAQSHPQPAEHPAPRPQEKDKNPR
jgi:hypothetical protein